MFPFNLSKTLKANQNQLFGQTRWRLATWYAGIMGAILILCGLGVYKALIYAHRLTITQELESVANNFHEILEPILEQPAKLTPAATAILPNLCVMEAECDKFMGEETEHSILQPPKYYYVRLLDLTGNLIALGGRQPEGMIVDGTKEYWDSSHHNYYQQVSLMLHTQDFQNWGYLEVGRNFPEYKLYIVRLQLIFLVGLLIVMLVLIIMSWWLAGKAIQPIHQSYQLLQQFTADAAHELRTPLAAIRATVESSLMVSELTEIEARETLTTIGRQNLRLSNLVADLLMLCRIDRQLSLTHSASVAQEKISLFDLIQDIGEDFASLSIKSEIKLLTKILVDEPLVIIGNYEQLYRMVSNLVANGLKLRSCT